MSAVRVERGGVGLHGRCDGPDDAPAIVFLNSLGTTLEIWDRVTDALSGYRIVRMDLRGHGRSDVPVPPYAMGALVADAEAVIDRFGVRDAVVVGLSIGGLLAQGLAVKRMDICRAMVLSNTAVKIGTPDLWAERIAAVEAGGMEAVAEGVLDRWFAPDFAHRTAWRARLQAVDPAGYAGCCAAISGTDMLTPTSGLRLPTLAIAGSQDRATPPDMVRETAGLIPGARFELMRNIGHLPPVEAPGAMAELLLSFLKEIGH